MNHRRHLQTILGIIFGAICALLLTAHAGATDHPRAGDFTDEFHQTYPLSATGRVSLSNINGGVHISTWNQNQVKVDAVKWADSREKLDEARIEVESSANSIDIRTQYEHRNNNNPATIEYTLTVPATETLDEIKLVNGSLQIKGVTGDVKADSVNGRIEAEGLQGETRLNTVNGRLVATFDRLGSQRIRLSSVNGSMNLTIPSDSNADVRANSVNGGIHTDFNLPVKHHFPVSNELNGTLGKGGAEIKLDNVNGAIDIHHAADGKPLSPATSKIKTSSHKDDDDDDMD